MTIMGLGAKTAKTNLSAVNSQSQSNPASDSPKREAYLTERERERERETERAIRQYRRIWYSSIIVF
jgi:hypothetical protein